jgi:DNA-binding MarR family transcriptional regulator
MHAVAFALKRAHLRTLRISTPLAREFGLTPARYDLLLAIRSGARTQSALWKMLHLSRATVSRMVIALEKLGFVRRRRIRGRASLAIQLTGSLENRLPELLRGWPGRAMCRLFEGFHPEQRTRVGRAGELAKLLATIMVVANGFGDRSSFTYPFTHRDRRLYYTTQQEGIVPRRLRVLCQTPAARRVAVTTMPPTTILSEENASRMLSAYVTATGYERCEIEEYID